MNYREKAREIHEVRVALMKIRIALSLKREVGRLMRKVREVSALLLVALCGSLQAQSIALTPGQLEQSANQRLVISGLSIGFGAGIGSILMLQDDENLQTAGMAMITASTGIGISTFIGSARKRAQADRIRRAGVTAWEDGRW